MSYILDAIAKSEQERRQLEVPGAKALSIPAEAGSPPRRLAPILIVIALVLNAAVVGVWIQSEKSIEEEAGNAAVVVSKPAQKVEAEVVEQSTGSEKDNQPVVEAAKTAKTEQVRIDAEPVTVKVEKEAVDDGWVRIEPNSLQESVRAAENVQAARGDNPAGETLVVSRLRDLPESVRKDLPTVKFSGHLYSSDPSSSLVFLDNQRPVMQGQQIVEEVYLNEITADGVVVEFRGYLIEVGVLQNWTLN